MIEIASPSYSSSAAKVVTTPRLAAMQKMHGFAVLFALPIFIVFFIFVIANPYPGPTEWITFFGLYVVTGLGVDVGFHRYFTHRSFQCPRAVQAILAVLGMMSGVGTLIWWVATHRQHHEHSDEEEDPHSPWQDGQSGVWQLWRAHAGWLFNGEMANPLRYTPDILREPMLRRLNRLYLLWVAIGLLIPFAIGYAVHGTLDGAFRTLLWGGLIRMFVLLHVILGINSICHWWGFQRYETRDQSRNNLLLGIPSFGEAYHNNHHAFPASAIYGHEWWEIDIGGVAIRCMQAMGLAWDVKTPKHEHQASKLLD